MWLTRLVVQDTLQLPRRFNTDLSVAMAVQGISRNTRNKENPSAVRSCILHGTGLESPLQCGYSPQKVLQE